jgi:hypothetical protein
MKPFTSESLAEAGVFAIRQTLRRIISAFEKDPNMAVGRRSTPRQRRRQSTLTLMQIESLRISFATMMAAGMPR